MDESTKNPDCPPLEIGCPKCNGDGRIDGHTCYECDGSGRQITEFGQSILVFISNHLRVSTDVGH